MSATTTYTESMSSVIVATAVEYLLPVWVELVLACFSAIAYCMFSSNAFSNLLSPKPKAPNKAQSASNALTKAQLLKLASSASSASPSLSSPRSSSGGGDIAQSSLPAAECIPQISVTSKQNHKLAMRANDIRSCGRNGNLSGAIKVFEKLGGQAADTLVFNSILDACVQCHDLTATIAFFEQAKKSGMADTVTYNKMMKGYLSQGQEASARRILVEMIHRSIANATSFHGLVNARVSAGDLRGAWKVVTEMQSNGISPNAVTCAILLKGTMSSLAEVSRVLVLVDAMSEPMDEVLFMAVAEACIRINRLDMLTGQLERFRRHGLCDLSSETYGSLIKAYGRARDTRRVWELWSQMSQSPAQLTSVTVGCMVEALVANGQTKEAWKLVKDMLNVEGTQPLVNTVICSSLLKGFGYSRDADKVMVIYREMQAHKIQPNTIAFNTILNTFAQCGTMQHAPELLEDMKSLTPPVEPDIVTFSTLVKGYCHAGSLDRALQVFNAMQVEGKCVPDEVMFNSLLGGCAKEFRIEDALRLLDNMKKCRIAPSNYTLSMLVKLMCRCRRLDQAFAMLENISKEYNFSINIQVYTCLIQGCFFHGQCDKALSVYDKMIKEGLVLDATTYTVLARGCLRAGNLDKAADLVRLAHGINAKGTQSKKTSVGVHSTCLDEVVAALGGRSGKSGAGAALLAELESQEVRLIRVYRGQ